MNADKFRNSDVNHNQQKKLRKISYEIINHWLTLHTKYELKYLLGASEKEQEKRFKRKYNDFFFFFFFIQSNKEPNGICRHRKYTHYLFPQASGMVDTFENFPLINLFLTFFLLLIFSLFVFFFLFHQLKTENWSRARTDFQFIHRLALNALPSTDKIE